ncbi:hypothetical protein [Jatrophihabitans sp.]|uniref:hypothetical protein n=1 Tax=Jatrophihabitans sp. TaxID=1932789 RepID=UPI0030C678D7|nr:hypothetical protein [Jatrophihabitans sp.]
MSVVLSMLQSSYERADIVEATFRDEEPGLRHYRRIARDRGYNAAQKKISEEIRRARKYIAENPAGSDPTETQFRLVKIADAIEQRPSWFPGKAGTTDHLVLMNLVGIAKLANNLRFQASVRQLAVATGMRSSTTATSLRRLTQDGRFVTLVGSAHGTSPATYELRLPSGPADDLPELPDDQPLGRSAQTLINIDDTFAAANLGSGAGRTFAVLDPRRPTPLAEIATMTSRSESTVSTHLRRLTANGLVQRTSEGYIRTAASMPDPKPVRALRRQTFATEREEFHRWHATRGAALHRATRRRQSGADPAVSRPVTTSGSPTIGHLGPTDLRPSRPASERNPAQPKE